jgi:threonyl-tRNA synthetase
MTGLDRVPYVIVVGDEEVASKKLTVTVRKKSQPGKPFKEQITSYILIASIRDTL